MTAALDNNFNGGPDGTTITTANSGQLGDTPFDSVVVSGSGTSLTFADAGVLGLNRPTANFVLSLATGSASSTSYVMWSTSMGSQHVVYARFYVMFTSIAGTTADQPVFTLINPIGVACTFGLRTSSSPYRLYLKDTASSVALGTVTPVANVWNRIELMLNSGTSSFTGAATAYFYADPDSDTANYTEIISQSSANYGNNSNLYPFSQYALGHYAAAASTSPAIYYSNLELNNTGYPGPSPFRQGLGSPMGNLTNSIALHSDIC